jgi:hypothetical protein
MTSDGGRSRVAMDRAWVTWSVGLWGRSTRSERATGPSGHWVSVNAPSNNCERRIAIVEIVLGISAPRNLPTCSSTTVRNWSLRHLGVALALARTSTFAPVSGWTPCCARRRGAISPGPSHSNKIIYFRTRRSQDSARDRRGIRPISERAICGDPLSGTPLRTDCSQPVLA